MPLVSALLLALAAQQPDTSRKDSIDVDAAALRETPKTANSAHVRVTRLVVRGDSAEVTVMLSPIGGHTLTLDRRDGQWVVRPKR